MYPRQTLKEYPGGRPADIRGPLLHPVLPTVGGREPSARGLTPTQTPSTTRKLRVSTLEFPAAPGGRNQPLAVRPSTALPILEPKWLRLRRTHLGPHVAPKGSLGREASLPENAVSTNVEQGGDWAQSWQIPDDGTSAGITPHVLQYAHSSDVFPRSGCAGVQSACRLHPPGVDGSRLRHGPPTTSERHTSEVMRRGCWISSSTYRFGSSEQSPTGSCHTTTACMRPLTKMVAGERDAGARH